MRHFYQIQKERALYTCRKQRVYKINKKIKENMLHMKLVRKKQNKYWRRAKKWIIKIIMIKENLSEKKKSLIKKKQIRRIMKD